MANFMDINRNMELQIDQDKMKLNDLRDAIQYKEESLEAEEKSAQALASKLSSPEARMKFFEENKEFIRLNWNMILTPKILVENRDLILEQMNHVFGDLNVEMASADDTDKRLEQFSYRFERDRYQTEIKQNVISVMTFWKNRANRIRRIRASVGRLIELRTDSVCQYCHEERHGLRSEPLWVLEDVFMEFMASNQGNRKKSTLEWQKFFVEKCPVRTICYKCTLKIAKMASMTSK